MTVKAKVRSHRPSRIPPAAYSGLSAPPPVPPRSALSPKDQDSLAAIRANCMPPKPMTKPQADAVLAANGIPPIKTETWSEAAAGLVKDTIRYATVALEWLGVRVIEAFVIIISWVQLGIVAGLSTLACGIVIYEGWRPAVAISETATDSILTLLSRYFS